MVEKVTRNEYLEALFQLIPTKTNGGHIYTLEFFTRNNECYAVGIDSENSTLGSKTSSLRQCKIKLQMQPYLPIWTNDINEILSLIHLNVLDLKRTITTANDTEFTVTSSNAIDFIISSDSYSRKWHQFNVPVKTFEASRQLFYYLNGRNQNGQISSPGIFNLKTTGTWSLELLLMLEMKKHTESYDECNFYHVWLSSDFNVDRSQKAPNIPIVSLDIETVSHEDHRMPMGENLTDILFSVSITHVTGKTEETGQTEKDRIIQYSLLHLPVPETELKRVRQSPTLITNNEAVYANELKDRRIVLFNSERELLTYVVDFFDSFNGSVYIFLGHNSKCYDFLYLAKRLAFHNMKQVNSIYNQNGILAYNVNMIHVDMMQVIGKYYQNELSSFSLKNITKTLLEDSEKVDLDARLLRYIYMNIFEKQSIGDGTWPKYKATLDRMMYYNDMDSFLVYKLWSNLQYASFLFVMCKTFCISLSRISQSKVNEYLSHKIYREGFKQSTVFVPATSCRHSVARFPDSDSYVYTEYDSELLALTQDVGLSGGFNYRLGTDTYKNVYSMDYVAYLPFLIDGFNISHETVAIHTVGFLRQCLEYLPNASQALSLAKIYRFCSHRGLRSDLLLTDDDLENLVNSRRYINGQLDNASSIKLDDLQRLPINEKIIVILAKEQKHGILSKITNAQNEIRDVAKNNKKLLSMKIQETVDQIKKIMFHETMQMSQNQKYQQQDDDELMEFEESGDEGEFIESGHESKELVEDDMFMEDDESMENNKSMNGDNNKVSGTNYSSCDIDNDSSLVQIKCTFIKSITSVKDIKQLKEYLSLLRIEFARLNGIYRNLKIVNSSIYGLLGAPYGVLKGIQVAAVTTCLGRKYIIETGKVGESCGFSLVLVDTDSTFFYPYENQKSARKSSETIQKHMKRINHNLQLGNKIYENVYVIQKKTYFAKYDKVFSKGITKNGPSLWAEVLYSMFDKYIVQEQPFIRRDLKKVLCDLYSMTYDRVKRNKSLVLCTANAKEIHEYKSQTAMKKLLTRITNENPEYVFGRKITYFFLLKNNCKYVHFAIDYELAETPLHKINLYKFYSKISQRIYNILYMALVNTNKKRGFFYMLSFDDFAVENLAAFIETQQSVSQRLPCSNK